MTPEEEIANLQHEVQTLKHQVEVLSTQLSSAHAKIEELQTKYDPVDPIRQFGYKMPMKIGAFDMFDVMAWEHGTARENGVWNASIIFRNSTYRATFDELNFKQFALQYEAYLKRP